MSNHTGKANNISYYIRVIFHFIKRTFVISFIQRIVAAGCLSRKEYYLPRVAVFTAYTT